MKQREIDGRNYDTTQLREGGHGKCLARDYTAHFFRWSFARRFIKNTDYVLDVGCGQDRPLSKILTGGAAARVEKYVGVDLNKLKPCDSQRITLLGEFNLVEDYPKLAEHLPDDREGFDVLIHLEVIEHMNSAIQPQFLEACNICLRPGGIMIMSTPCYDGVHHAKNHIRELTVAELQILAEEAGFEVVKRYGTFMNIKYIGKDEPRGCSREAVLEVRKALEEYFDSDAISNFFGPLYPDHARNNVWICRKPEA